MAQRTSLTPYGVCVHTTGRGVPDKALREHRTDVASVALELYSRPGENFPHYCIDWGGCIYQIADEQIRAWHVAITLADRARYWAGSWKTALDPSAVDLWNIRWPGVKSPLHLFPSRAPNNDYLGVELIPRMLRERWPYNQTLFTDAQYAALSRLLTDIEDRYAITLTGSRLVGHEDISPLTRWDSLGGWDPGALRARPYFDWSLVSPSTPLS